MLQKLQRHSRKLKQKREAITYLSYSTCKEYLHVQLLFSLTLNEVQYIPLLKISGVPSLFAFSVRNVTSSNHSIQCCIRNVKLLLDLLGAQHRVESIRQIVLTKVFYLIATHSTSSYLLPLSSLARLLENKNPITILITLPRCDNQITFPYHYNLEIKL